MHTFQGMLLSLRFFLFLGAHGCLVSTPPLPFWLLTDNSPIVAFLLFSSASPPKDTQPESSTKVDI